MKLHTAFITYNRLELTKRAIKSYLETVSVPYTFVVVDNGSTDGTEEWLRDNVANYLLLGRNTYPGFACNRGWELGDGEVTFFHRADNDFAYLRGWCEEAIRRFQVDNIGQVGLRTGPEEMYARWNVGGNCIIRRKLWDDGLRYNETPWPDLPAGFSEDSFLSPEVVKMGYRWTRVNRPCIVSLASGDWDDEYYQKSYGDRRIERPS